MQIPYLSARVRKLPRVMGANIGSMDEICKTSGLPNPMVPRLHQCNGYIKRKLLEWRIQKCISLVSACAVLQVRVRKLPCVMGGIIASREEIFETLSQPNPMVPRLHQCNGYIKRKLPVLRVQKCIALVGSDTVLTSARPQTTPCHVGQYRVHGGNLRIFGLTKPHGTAFAPMQWLYKKEATGMESSKMYCPCRWRYRTYQRGAANSPLSWGAV